MWCRYTEMLMGAWLAASPFLLAYSERVVPTCTAIGCGLATIALAALSFVPRIWYAHFGELAVAGCLLIVSYWTSMPTATVATQNQIIVGLILMMFSIIPNRATTPPSEWLDYAIESES